MINIKINNQEVTEIISDPVITQSKSRLQSTMYIDKTLFTVKDEIGSFIPFSINSILDNDILENNTVEIFDGNTQLFKGVINEINPKPQNENIIEIECKTELFKYKYNYFEYKTWLRGDGVTTYPVGEYFLGIDGKYYETPAYAVYHYLQISGYTNFDLNSILSIHSIYQTAGAYIQIDTSFKNMNVQMIVDYICKKTGLFIYVNDLGNITFIHDITGSTDIGNDISNDIKSALKLNAFNNYSIELVDFSFRTAFDNAYYGSEYRTEFNIMFSILKGIIYVYNNNSADYFGQFIIDNFYRERQGIIITFDISADFQNIFEFYNILNITSKHRNWINKQFEMYILTRNFNNSKYILDCYEKL